MNNKSLEIILNETKSYMKIKSVKETSVFLPPPVNMPKLVYLFHTSSWIVLWKLFILFQLFGFDHPCSHPPIIFCLSQPLHINQSFSHNTFFGNSLSSLPFKFTYYCICLFKPPRSLPVFHRQTFSDHLNILSCNLFTIGVEPLLHYLHVLYTAYGITRSVFSGCITD